MPESVTYIDCCGKPVLATVKSFLATEYEMVDIRRCLNCGCHWFYHLREYTITTDEYDRRKWYVRLSHEEVGELLKLDAPPPPSLFADRPGFLRDEDGMSKIKGIPYFLESCGG